MLIACRVTGVSDARRAFTDSALIYNQYQDKDIYFVFVNYAKFLLKPVSDPRFFLKNELKHLHRIDIWVIFMFLNSQANL